MLAATAATNGGVDDVFEPWCGTTNASARSACPFSRSSHASLTASISPVNNALPKGESTRNTHDRSFVFTPGSPYCVIGGNKTVNVTPSHCHDCPAVQRQAVPRSDARETIALSTGSDDHNTVTGTVCSNDNAPPA